MTCTSNTLVLLRKGLGGFSITHSGILRDGAFARQLTPQRCGFKTISIDSAKARTRDFLLVLELYHLFCNIVGGVLMDPWGLPLYVWFQRQSSRYPALRSPLMRRMKRSSLMVSRRMESKSS